MLRTVHEWLTETIYLHKCLFMTELFNTARVHSTIQYIARYNIVQYNLKLTKQENPDLFDTMIEINDS